ncbi:MAG: hypothetical protein ABL931_13650 [Usitatibacteraceae bacterium]
MTEHSFGSKRAGRFKRYGVIGGAIAIVVIVMTLLWGRAGSSLGSLLKSAPAAAAVQSYAGRAKAAVRASEQAAATPASAAPRVGEPAWAALLEKLMALLSGKKIEVCGLSDLEAALFLAGDSEAGTGAVDSVLAEVTGKLLRSDLPGEHFLGLYAQAQLSRWSASNASGREYRICGADFDCIVRIANQKQTAVNVPEVTPAAEPLVKLALSSRDPNVTAAAVHACEHTRSEACGMIKLSDWAETDPENAFVWLRIATAAGKDDAARNAALRRAAISSMYDPRVPSLAPIFNSELVQAQTALVRSSIGNAIGSSSSLASMSPIWGLTSYCLHDKSIDPSRNALCDALTNKLLEKDDSAVGLSMAIHLGKRLGWDEARLEALRDEKATVLGPMMEGMSDEKIYSCGWLDKNIQLTREMLSTGERSLARERIAKSGQSFSEVAKKYRERDPNSYK